VGQAVPPAPAALRQGRDAPTGLRVGSFRYLNVKERRNSQPSGRLEYWKPSDTDHYYRYSFEPASSKFCDRGLGFRFLASRSRIYLRSSCCAFLLARFPIGCKSA